MSRCSFSLETHMPVIDNKSKELIFENGKLVLHAKQTNTIVYADLTESIINTYNLSKYLKIIPPQMDNQSKNIMDTNKNLCTDKIGTIIKAEDSSNEIDEKEIIEYTKKKFIVVNPNTGRVIAVMGADNKKTDGSNVTSSTCEKTDINNKNDNNCKNTDNKNSKISANNSGTVSSTGTSKKRAIWTTDATLSLINCYRQIDALKIRNESTWRKISEAMKLKNYLFTSTQCKDRFYYLKCEYCKKIDMMKNNNNNSETENISFEYYDEFNEIFGTTINDTPEYAVSSRRSCQLSFGEINDEQTKDDKSSPKCKKRKLTNTEKIFKKSNEKRERRERHHREKVELQKKAIAELKIATELLKKALENKS